MVSFMCVLLVGFLEEVFYEVVVVGGDAVELYLFVVGVDAVVWLCRIAEGDVDEVVAVVGPCECRVVHRACGGGVFDYLIIVENNSVLEGFPDWCEDFREVRADGLLEVCGVKAVGVGSFEGVVAVVFELASELLGPVDDEGFSF